MLPEPVTTWLCDAAAAAGAAPPELETALFDAGILDSFALVELVALLEEHCGVRLADSDLRAANFTSLRRIEAFLAERR